MAFRSNQILLFVTCALAAGAATSFAAPQEPPEVERLRASAARVPEGAIRVDGRLDETAWREAPALSRFVQKEPVEGQPATDAMDVRFVYDGDALYIGARMTSSAPIQAPMGRRDEVDQAEHLLVSLDTYLDRRTASTFGVTAAGVRLDHYHPTDDEEGDPGFDPVWQARTTMDAGGWSAELWIPFSQLRFNERSPHIWGLNVRRWIPSSNEDVYWALVPRTAQGWASRFGDLEGIDGIRPSRRLELLPYIASSSEVVGGRNPANPFDAGANLEGRVGMDVKVGIGPNLTLEATVNPDFGQVEADPAEVNLTAFETFFDERRPFFVERGGLLEGNVNNYFYSRRIGAAPAGSASGDFVDFPRTTTILGATKLTGRLSSGTSIGMLGAVTADESARTFVAPATTSRVRVAPRTVYGVARVEQEFGPPGSTWSLMTTGLHRDIDEGDPLGSLLARRAFTLSGDTVMRLRNGEYQVNLFTGLGYVDGAAPAIDRIQRAASHYLQRPDAGYLTYDPSRTSLAGTKSGIIVERRNGRHWLWNGTLQVETPEYETNELGRLTAADGINGDVEIIYRETIPGRWYRTYSATLGLNNEWTYDRDQQRQGIESLIGVTWPNFWETNFDLNVNLRAQDAWLTRGGPSMETPRGWNVNLRTETSPAAETRSNWQVEYGRDEDGGERVEFEAGVSLRPTPRWSLSITPEYVREVNTQQYVTARTDGTAATFGGRYVFARIDRSTYLAQARLSYTFKPDLTLDLYAEPFAASGRYDGFGELAATRGRLLRRYGQDGTRMTVQADGSRVVADGASSFTLPNRDFKVQSFRSNLVLRWEWRVGSILYFVWQQNREQEETRDARASLGDLFSSAGARGDNFFAVKASFWISP